MRRIISLVATVVMATIVVSTPVLAGATTTIGTNVTPWDSNYVPGPGEAPIGGSGQVNGGFVVAEWKGIELGIRAQERRVGPITPRANGNVGVYQAESGFDDGALATWNYDWHVDLRDATGPYAGKTLGDYKLVLASNIGRSVYECTFPCDLVGLAGGALDAVVLFQQSWNPVFGGTGFDVTAERSYSFQLTLKPVTFQAQPIKVRMRVDVADS